MASGAYSSAAIRRTNQRSAHGQVGSVVSWGATCQLLLPGAYWSVVVDSLFSVARSWMTWGCMDGRGARVEGQG